MKTIREICETVQSEIQTDNGLEAYFIGRICSALIGAQQEYGAKIDMNEVKARVALARLIIHFAFCEEPEASIGRR